MGAGLEMTAEKFNPSEAPDTTDGTTSDFGCKVVLFNCNCHSFSDVEQALQKATGCGLGKARSLANQVHETGNAVVYEGEPEKAESVAIILEDARLVVKVTK
jgi:ATP-dependent Clp protease adapter protein ClpS